MEDRKGTESTQAPKPAAIYTRISRDKESEQAGVTRQLEDCLVLAEREGYTVAEEDIFKDNDISASTASTKERPRYDEMMRRAKLGQFKAILAYSNSRLTRRPREFEDLIDLYKKHGVKFHTVASGSFDLATTDGRRMARFLAGEATAEAERTGERVARAKKQAAEEGRFRGGRRPYGFRKDGVTHDEKEVAIIRDAAEQILAGRSLRAVAADLKEQGAPTPVSTSDKGWTYHTLRNVLLRPRNAGLIAHGTPARPQVGETKNGDVYRLAYEVVGKAQWDPILDEDTWRAVVTKLTDPSRRSAASYEPAWLLSGILMCGECGAPMRHAPYGPRPSNPTRKQGHLYRCSEHNHRTIEATKTDDYILDYVTRRVRNPLVIAAMNSEKADELAADRIRRGELEASLAQTERDYDADLIDGRRFAAKKARIDAELAEVDGRIAAGLAHTAASEIFAASDPGTAFEGAALDLQRAVIRTLITVKALAAVRRGAPWTKDRLDIANLV